MPPVMVTAFVVLLLKACATTDWRLKRRRLWATEQTSLKCCLIKHLRPRYRGASLASDKESLVTP